MFTRVFSCVSKTRKFNSSPLISKLIKLISRMRKALRTFLHKVFILRGFFKLYRLFLIRSKISFAKVFGNDEPSHRTQKQLPARLLRTWGISSCNITQITGNGIKLKEIVRDRLYASIPIKLQFPYERARRVRAHKNTKWTGRRTWGKRKGRRWV